MISPLVKSSSTSMKILCKSQRLLIFTVTRRRSSQSSKDTTTTTARIDKNRSPYVVLELRKSATKDDIKSQFRKVS